jgi:hypothetical protein
MSELLCDRCGDPALVIYEGEPKCGPCALLALDENHHYLVVQVDHRDTPADDGTRNRKSA